MKGTEKSFPKILLLFEAVFSREFMIF